MCKFWKVNGYRTEKVGGEKFSDHRRRHAARSMSIEEARAYAPEALV